MVPTRSLFRMRLLLPSGAGGCWAGLRSCSAASALVHGVCSQMSKLQMMCLDVFYVIPEGAWCLHSMDVEAGLRPPMYRKAKHA
ncbi:hypothetical protein GE09DRAFT_729611 [Coniochaeta sp. 2T2.1]|nr:hypothetical protein GE09DRAFT_729611 [Coniochaeta sp. 2T2.1]